MFRIDTKIKIVKVFRKLEHLYIAVSICYYFCSIVCIMRVTESRNNTVH